jgi:hypothetical protein
MLSLQETKQTHFSSHTKQTLTRIDVSCSCVSPSVHLLTPCSRVQLQKLTGVQLVKKFPSFDWNPKDHHHIHYCQPPVPVLSQLDQFAPPHPSSCRPILVLSSHRLLGLPNGLFTAGFPTKTLYAPLLSTIMSSFNFYATFAPLRTWLLEGHDWNALLSRCLHGKKFGIYKSGDLAGQLGNRAGALSALFIMFGTDISTATACHVTSFSRHEENTN